MTLNNTPNFDLIRAIILLLLIFLTISLFLFGLCEHDNTALCYGALSAVVTTFLGKKWTT